MNRECPEGQAEMLIATPSHFPLLDEFIMSAKNSQKVLELETVLRSAGDFYLPN